MTDAYHRDLIDRILSERPGKKRINALKMDLSRAHHRKVIPTDIEVLLNAEPLEHKRLSRYLLTKPVRAASGVSVVAVMTKPHRCPHGKCIMCPGGPDSVFGTVPQSYTGEEPATRRAKRCGYDPYLQVFSRLMQYVSAGHIPCKVELIIMGGTFPANARSYQESFVASCLKAMNDFARMFFRTGALQLVRFKKFFDLPRDLDDPLRELRVRKRIRSLIGTADLEREQRRNESSFIRVVGLTIETRSDYGTLREGNMMLSLGCTRVELGVQSVYDSSLRRMERGHTTRQTIESIQTLKDMGFKINAHYMPGLFVSKNKDLEGMRQLFDNPLYRPDMLKIYPCMVMPGTMLHTIWKRGKYQPLSTEEAADLIARFKEHVPRYCRIMRVQRDIPTKMTVAGIDRTNLRQRVTELMQQRGTRCRCIRCKEIGAAKLRGPISIKEMRYAASSGTEFFISAEANRRLVGFCRLRFPGQTLRNEITEETALIRELHVYGPQAALGFKGAVQHRGIGKRLLAAAERIARKNHKEKMVIISGIGVREYYRMLGYRREGPYMVKLL
jgi:elongator complex protein 3